jgi:aminopeptidase N
MTSRKLTVALPLVLGFALAAPVLIAPQAVRAEAPFALATTPGKLSKDILPKSYRIDLRTDPDALTVGGHEEIEISIRKATDQILINEVDLSLDKVLLGGAAGQSATVTIDGGKQIATLHFAKPIKPGSYPLIIDYHGAIPATTAGLYYNDYATPQGKNRMLVTNFESTDARRMFPGWDEPVFKATYSLSVVVPKHLATVSNMPIIEESDAGTSDKGIALKKVQFATSPKMSSYLLALVVGDLERIHAQSAGSDVGVWTVAGRAEQGHYALHGALKVLPYYNDYFGVHYPLPKLDLIAIPGNFPAGAMENWGAITFIDSALLFDPANSSEETRREISLATAHEMAHQWSGDLVTMAWWDDIWLNEGFASWMNNKALDHFHPDWQVWLRAHLEKETAMALDARFTTHPIQQKIEDESAIQSAFDAITYLKGQSFIRMIESYLGEEKFRDGMRTYMKAHAYSNATTADLWEALAAASGKPVPQIAAGFTEQPGIPLIHVDRACDNGAAVITLSQSRFAIHDPNAAALHWQVPVTLGVMGEKPMLQTILIGAKPEIVRIPSCGTVVKANFGDTGYYRTIYDPASDKALAAQFASMSALDRVNFIGDRWSAVEAGLADARGYLDLTGRLTDEKELAIWEDTVSSFRQIDDLLRGSPDRAAFCAYARRLLTPEFNRLGWDAKPGDSADAGILRARMIMSLGWFDDEKVIAEAKARFRRFLTDPDSLPATLRDPVIMVVGYGADQATFDQIHNLGRKARGTEEKLRYYGALAGARNPRLIEQTVAIATTDEISNGRVNRFLIEVARQSDNPDLVWQKTLMIADQVMKKLTDRQRVVLLAGIATASANPAIADELQALPAIRASSGGLYEASKAVEAIHFKADFRRTLEPAVSGWLKQAT